MAELKRQLTKATSDKISQVTQLFLNHMMASSLSVSFTRIFTNRLVVMVLGYHLVMTSL